MPRFIHWHPLGIDIGIIRNANMNHTHGDAMRQTARSGRPQQGNASSGHLDNYTICHDHTPCHGLMRMLGPLDVDPEVLVYLSHPDRNDRLHMSSSQMWIQISMVCSFDTAMSQHP